MWAAASSVGLALCSAASLVIVLASCGKDEAMPRDISMPIDDFPPSAELYLHDVQGTPVARVDALGRVVAEAATHPYGAVRYESGSVEPYGFVGNERDFGAGVSDFQARPYRPELSRFLAVDPVPLFEAEAFSEPFRWQAYTYAAGDPVNGVDVDGREVLGLGVYLSAGAGWGVSLSGGVYVAWGNGGRGVRVGLYGSAGIDSGVNLGAGAAGGLLTSRGSEAQALDGASSYVSAGGGAGLVGAVTISKPYGHSPLSSGGPPSTQVTQLGVGLKSPIAVFGVAGVAQGGHHRLFGREGTTRSRPATRSRPERDYRVDPTTVTSTESGAGECTSGDMCSATGGGMSAQPEAYDPSGDVCGGSGANMCGG